MKKAEDPNVARRGRSRAGDRRVVRLPSTLTPAEIEEVRPSEPDRPTRVIGPDELERVATEAGDLDAIVRAELERLPAAERPPLAEPGPDPGPHPRRRPVLSLVAGLAIAAVAVVAIASLGTLGDRSPEPIGAASTAGRPQGAPATSPATTSSPATSSSPAGTASPSATTESPAVAPMDRWIAARLVFTAPCWVEAVADGGTVLRETFSSGVRVVRARHTLTLTLGNGGGVQLLVNGRPVATGSEGEVAHLSFALQRGRAVQLTPSNASTGGV